LTSVNDNFTFERGSALAVILIRRVWAIEVVEAGARAGGQQFLRTGGCDRVRSFARE
jgi:hypothetical protein